MRNVLVVCIVVVVAGTASTAFGQEADASGLSTSWREFHRAFLAVVERNPKQSVERLQSLRESHPEHAAAVFARPVLEMFRTRIEIPKETIPPSSERPSTEKHPAVRDESSAVYDPAWVRYREAFVEVVARRANRAEPKLQGLVDRYPDHPAAPLAREVLAGLETRPPNKNELARKRASDEASESTGLPDPNGEAAPLGWRIAGETVGAVAGAAGGGLALGLGGGLLGLAIAPRTMVPPIFASFGGMIGAAGGFPLGTYFAGKWLGANGDLGGAYLGALAGVGGGLVAGLVAPSLTNGRRYLVELAPIGGLVGGVVGYELSHRGFMKRQQRLSRPRIRPLVTPSRRAKGPVIGIDVDF